VNPIRFWVVLHAHRFGNTVWPVQQRRKPTLKSLLRTCAEFGRDWEGEGRRDGAPPRDDEYIEIFGPFVFDTSGKLAPL